jgi:hypothetical protein
MYKNIIKTIFNKNSNNSFILDKLYLTNKFNCSLRIEEFKIDNFDGFTVIYLVYLSYLQQFTNLKQIKSFYKYCQLSLNARLNQNINLLEFIYLTAFNKLLGGKLKSYDIILFLQKNLKENLDFKLYKIFYKNYFNFKIPKYEKINITKSVINKSNKLLGNQFYTVDMYKKLDNNDKKFLTNLFYTTFIDSNNYIDIHPIIFNYSMYKSFLKKIGYNTSDSIRIIIGESFNKLGLLMDLYYKSDSYYVPFSKNIYNDDKFNIDKKYKQYLTKEYLSSFKFIINNLIPFDIMQKAKKIYIYDLINSGKGILSFLHIFNIMFPEFKNKIKLILISDTINDKYKLYYSSNNKIEIKKKLKQDNVKFKIFNFKCNIYILSVFTQEYYNYRCFKSLPIEKINNKHINIFESYDDNINKNNLIKFYIINQFV